jgi:hypothetical protein
MRELVMWMLTLHADIHIMDDEESKHLKNYHR